MDIYIVKPNLEISDCENCPSESTLLSKKSAYLTLLKQCNKLSQLNGGDSQVPIWCKNGTCYINTKPELLEKNDNGHDNSEKNDAESSTPPDNNNNNHHHHHHNHTHHTLSLQSVSLSPEDYTKLEPDSNEISLSKLDIPNNISQIDGKWLALKYLQLNSDIALLRYKYLKSYAKITKLLKKYFSKQDISESDETEGFKLINDEMSKFKIFENILTLLLELKKKFHARFSHFEEDFNDQNQENDHDNDKLLPVQSHASVATSISSLSPTTTDSPDQSEQ